MNSQFHLLFIITFQIHELPVAVSSADGGDKSKKHENGTEEETATSAEPAPKSAPEVTIEPPPEDISDRPRNMVLRLRYGEMRFTLLPVSTVIWGIAAVHRMAESVKLRFDPLFLSTYLKVLRLVVFNPDSVD